MHDATAMIRTTRSRSPCSTRRRSTTPSRRPQKAFAAASDVDALTTVRHQHLGDRAPVSLARREIGALPPQAKADAGKRVNEARAAHPGRLRRPAGASCEADRARRALVEEAVDVTLPWDRRPRGARHPLTTLMERIGDLFVGMGYEIAEGPEVELEWANFDALNIAARPPGPRPDGHVLRRRGQAGRGRVGLVLRTHTSPVQARTMLTRTPPIYVVVPGPGLPHRRAGRHPHAGLPPGRGARGGQGHHDGPPQGHAGPLRPGHVRRRGPDPLAPALLPVHRAVGRVRRVVPAAPRRPAVGRVGRLRHGQPAGAASPAASTPRCTPASRSAWASNAR